MPLSRRLLLLPPAVAFALALASCGGEPTAAVETRLLRVESVVIQVGPSIPPDVTAQFEGVLPDGCTSLGAVSQERQGNTILVTVMTVRTGEICTQVARLVSERVRLQGAFPDGSYVVRINGVEARFSM